MHMNDKSGVIWEVTAYFQVLSLNLSGMR